MSDVARTKAPSADGWSAGRRVVRWCGPIHRSAPTTWLGPGAYPAPSLCPQSFARGLDQQPTVVAGEDGTVQQDLLQTCRGCVTGDVGDLEPDLLGHGDSGAGGSWFRMPLRAARSTQANGRDLERGSGAVRASPDEMNRGRSRPTLEVARGRERSPARAPRPSPLLGMRRSRSPRPGPPSASYSPRPRRRSCACPSSERPTPERVTRLANRSHREHPEPATRSAAKSPGSRRKATHRPTSRGRQPHRGAAP